MFLLMIIDTLWRFFPSQPPPQPAPQVTVNVTVDADEIAEKVANQLEDEGGLRSSRADHGGKAETT